MSMKCGYIERCLWLFYFFIKIKLKRRRRRRRKRKRKRILWLWWLLWFRIYPTYDPTDDPDNGAVLDPMTSEEGMVDDYRMSRYDGLYGGT